MSNPADSAERTEQYGGCPTCGAAPDQIREASKWSPAEYYCGACGCPLDGGDEDDTATERNLSERDAQ